MPKIANSIRYPKRVACKPKDPLSKIISIVLSASLIARDRSLAAASRACPQRRASNAQLLLLRAPGSGSDCSVIFSHL